MCLFGQILISYLDCFWLAIEFEKEEEVILVVGKGGKGEPSYLKYYIKDVIDTYIYDLFEFFDIFMIYIPTSFRQLNLSNLKLLFGLYFTSFT